MHAAGAAVTYHGYRPLPTTKSRNMREARLKSLNFYRDALRSITLIRERYQLDFSRDFIRDRIREEMHRNSHVKDTGVIDMLVFKGSNDLEEAKNLWKPKSNLVGFFEVRRPKKILTPEEEGDEFLKRFFAGYEIPREE